MLYTNELFPECAPGGGLSLPIPASGGPMESVIFAAYIVHYRALPKKLQSESDRYLSVDAVLWRAVRYSLPELLTRFLHT